MAASQNGWVANERDRVERQLVPDTRVYLTVRSDAPGLLLLEVAAAFDKFVEDIDNARGALDDWGYAERPIRGGWQLSNHASGTAIDLNATQHPLGVSVDDTFSDAEIDRIREIVEVTRGVVRWGGEWSRPDGMHFEIAPGQTMEDCERALVWMREYNGTDFAPAPEPEPSGPRLLKLTDPMMEGDDVRELQRVLAAWYPWMGLQVDGWYGPVTEDAVRQLQRRANITVDGIVGPQTRAVLGL